jgi:ubiquitin carboxyl-terminal hydrolase 48
MYELFAVLVHSGSSASSGHYTALIKDPVTRCTYRFNDTLIEKFADSKFDISKEEDNGNLAFYYKFIRMLH